jgi:hypothetical protein
MIRRYELPRWRVTPSAPTRPTGYPDDPSQNRERHFNAPDRGHYDDVEPGAPFGPLRR